MERHIADLTMAVSVFQNITSIATRPVQSQTVTLVFVLIVLSPRTRTAGPATVDLSLSI